MNRPDRKLLQDVYIRICHDSRYKMDAPKVANLAGAVLGVHGIAVWGAFAGLWQMEEIATGKHPACLTQRKPE